jgi:hypothetical protein
VMAPLGEAFGESAADLSGRAGDENFHLQHVGVGRACALEETDKRVLELARARGNPHNCLMYASAAPRIAVARSGASSAPAVAALSVGHLDRDVRGIVMPRPEVHLAVRFGPLAQRGLDVHALGGLQQVRRKLLPSGQRVVMARLHLGAAEGVLGVPDSAIAGRIVALESLWGDTATQRLPTENGRDSSATPPTDSRAPASAPSQSIWV